MHNNCKKIWLMRKHSYICEVMQAEFCPETYAVLGEERRSDTWYIPLDGPEILEFLYERKSEKSIESVCMREKNATKFN